MRPVQLQSCNLTADSVAAQQYSTFLCSLLETLSSPSSSCHKPCPFSNKRSFSPSPFRPSHPPCPCQVLQSIPPPSPNTVIQTFAGRDINGSSDKFAVTGGSWFRYLNFLVRALVAVDSKGGLGEDCGDEQEGEAEKGSDGDGSGFHSESSGTDRSVFAEDICWMIEGYGSGLE